MSRKKLAVNGNQIEGHSVVLMERSSAPGVDPITYIDLRVNTAEANFAYEIYRDVRFDDLPATRTLIDGLLNKAREDFLKVEISEYADRNYLFLNVQKNDQLQFSGRRIG